MGLVHEVFLLKIPLCDNMMVLRRACAVSIAFLNIAYKFLGRWPRYMCFVMMRNGLLGLYMIVPVSNVIVWLPLPWTTPSSFIRTWVWHHPKTTLAEFKLSSLRQFLVLPSPPLAVNSPLLLLVPLFLFFYLTSLPLAFYPSSPSFPQFHHCSTFHFVWPRAMQTTAELL